MNLFLCNTSQYKRVGNSSCNSATLHSTISTDNPKGNNLFASAERTKEEVSPIEFLVRFSVGITDN